MESTIEYLINEMSASQPFPLLERTLDYGDNDYPSKWDTCIRGEGLGPELVKDFRVKAHNSVQLPPGFGADLGVVLTRPPGVVGEPGFLYAFTRPGFTSDSNQALIYVEARAPTDGWGMHYLLERAGAHWKVVRVFCKG